MSAFVIGVLVGVTIFATLGNLFLVYKVKEELSSANKLIQLMFIKINKLETVIGKIDKVTSTTMDAAETFVDALRQSAEGMYMRPPMGRGDMPDNFDELRKAFEDGVRNYENTLNEEDESSQDDEEGPEEPWKKSK
jgi:hypothetical protein